MIERSDSPTLGLLDAAVLASQALFLWMFFAAGGLERIADATGATDAQAAAYAFASDWRHGMAGGSPLYMPGFFATAVATWFWARRLSTPALLARCAMLMPLAALAAHLAAPPGIAHVVAAFERATGIAYEAPTGPGVVRVAQGLYTLITWTAFVVAGHRALVGRSLRPFWVPAALSVGLALGRPVTVGDFTSLWAERVAAGDVVAIVSFALIPACVWLFVRCPLSVVRCFAWGRHTSRSRCKPDHTGHPPYVNNGPRTTDDGQRTTTFEPGLVLAGVLHRPTRSAVTAFGVALGVVLVMLTVGLARGQLLDRARREVRSGADIILRPSGSGLGAVSTVLAVDLAILPQVESVEGVEAVVPLAQHIERSEASSFGFRSFDGVDFDRYAEMGGLRVVEGRGIEGPDEALVDEYFTRTGQGSVGGSVSFAGRPLTIVGVYAPESMSRIKVPIETVQRQFEAEGHASMLLIKIRPEADVEAVARALRDRVPESQILLARDLPALFAAQTPALTTFLSVVVGLALVVSTLVIAITSYTTVLERTRQIGILKSLGASRRFIAGVVVREALVVGASGVVVGQLVSVVAAAVISGVTTLRIEVGAELFVQTALLGVAAAVVGALYPAIRAARLDPVLALAHD
jgi:putative ABC transport system permease protein